jgi:hypothetical protein
MSRKWLKHPSNVKNRRFIEFSKISVLFFTVNIYITIAD